jgi:hypothetical protein
MTAMAHIQSRTRAAVTKAHHRDLPTTRERILFALGVIGMFLLIAALNLAVDGKPLHGAAPSIVQENLHA